MTISNHKDSTYKFLIFINFTETSYIALDYLIKLVKMIGGHIEVFSIIDPVLLANNENQINVLRSIEAEEKRIERKLNSITEMIELEGIKTSSWHVIGNLKIELGLKLIQAEPDVVVIGKEKGTTGSALNYLINEYKKSVLILGEESRFLKGTEITIGYNPSTLDKHDFQLISIFSQTANLPLTLFKIVPDLKEEPLIVPSHIQGLSEGTDVQVRQKFQADNSVSDALLEKVSKENVELLCIGRSVCKKSFFRNIFKTSTTFKIAQKIKIPLFIMGKSKQTSLI